MSSKKIKKPLSLTVKPAQIKIAATPADGDPPASPEGEETTEDPYYATKEILDYAFKTWAGTFMNPMFYFMTRTFAHHRKGEKYDTGLVYNQLMQISGGDHDKLLEDLRAYGDTLQAELEPFLAARAAKR